MAGCPLPRHLRTSSPVSKSADWQAPNPERLGQILQGMICLSVDNFQLLILGGLVLCIDIAQVSQPVSVILGDTEIMSKLADPWCERACPCLLVMSGRLCSLSSSTDRPWHHWEQSSVCVPFSSSMVSRLGIKTKCEGTCDEAECLGPAQRSMHGAFLRASGVLS